MKSITTALGILSLVALLPDAGYAQGPAKNIIAKAGEAKVKRNNNGGGHSTLNGILQSAGFSTALGGAYTIFAPTNSAFAKLPQNRLSDLLRPENRAQLKAIMARHVLRGNVSFDEIKRAVEEGNGTATFRTLAGNSLTFKQSGDRVVLTDGRGNASTISASSMQRGGSTIYSVNTILM